jgi:vacuole morphology and inheritance protein 14
LPSGTSTVTQQAATQSQQVAIPTRSPFDDDLFDIRETVNQLTLQFLSEHEETRVAALEWLLMLHQKAPRRVSRELTARAARRPY